MQTITQIRENLLKERAEYLETQKNYIEEMSKLPHGVIITKNRNGKELYYLAYYNKVTKKNIQDAVKKKDLSTTQAQLVRYNQLKASLKELNEDLITLEKALGEFNKRLEKSTSKTRELLVNTNNATELVPQHTSPPNEIKPLKEFLP